MHPARTLFFAALLAATQAQAETCTWTAAANANLSNAANWSCTGAVTVPGSTDDVVFPANAATLSVINDFPIASPAFHTVTFAPGYTVGGNPLSSGLETVITGPFESTAPLNSAGWLRVNGVAGGGLVHFRGSVYNAELVVGNGTASAHAVMDATSNAIPVTVASQGRLSMGAGVTAATLDVQSGGTLALSEPPPGAAGGSQVGSATVAGAVTFAAGSTLEYHALTSYDAGRLIAQNSIALNGATLRIVVEDPANPDAIGFMRTLVAYGDSSKLTGRFAGLPASGALIEASNAPGVWYSVSYGVNSNAFIQITRVAAPPPPAPGNPAAIPALAPAGLALMSVLVASIGLHRRRKQKGQ